MKKINYRFDNGDIVRLTRDSGWDSAVLSDNYEDVLNRTFRIIDWGWRQTAPDVISSYYVLEDTDSDSRRCLRYDNEMTENMLEPAGETHPHEEDAVMMSTDGREICISEKVYANIYRKWYMKPLECNLDFVFACYGTVTRLQYQRGEKNIDNVYIRREFLCTFDDGTPRGDAGRKGYEMAYNSYETTVRIPDDYAEQYVNQVASSDHNYDVLESSYTIWKYEVNQWLNFIGVYDRVMALYAAKKDAGELLHMKEIAEREQRKQGERRKSIDKIRAFVDSLSPEEKAELKKML